MLPKSATKIFPKTSTEMPFGKLNFAEVPIPSAKPFIPDPAIVVTNPWVVIFLILWLFRSAIYKFPERSIATSPGRFIWAAVPIPSIRPAIPEPAKVVTTPLTEIFLILLLPQSET